MSILSTSLVFHFLLCPQGMGVIGKDVIGKDVKNHLPESPEQILIVFSQVYYHLEKVIIVLRRQPEI